MRFLVDECTGSKVAQWLRDEKGYEVFSVYDQARGSADLDILTKAFNEDWVLITNDRDFSQRIFQDKLSHKGIIFLRLEDERFANKILVLSKLLDSYSNKLFGQFVVVTETRVRFAKTS